MIDSARARHPELHVSALTDRRHHHPVCDAWHDERADSTFFRPVRSDIPTLILAGEFEPAARLDTSCVSEIAPVSFVTDVHVTPGAYPVARRIQNGPDRTVLAAAGLLGLILVSGLVGWPVGALVRRVRGRPTPKVAGLQRSARWLAAAAGLLAIGFAGGLALAIRETTVTNPFILAFGVSGEFGGAVLPALGPGGARSRRRPRGRPVLAPGMVGARLRRDTQVGEERLRKHGWVPAPESLKHHLAKAPYRG